MNSNYVSGINETQILVVINRITSNIEKLEARFNQIDQIILNTNNYYKSSSANIFRKNYDDIRLNYSIVKTNLLSYVEDLTNLISSYKKFETSTADVINTYKPIGEEK